MCTTSSHLHRLKISLNRSSTRPMYRTWEWNLRATMWFTDVFDKILERVGELYTCNLAHIQKCLSHAAITRVWRWGYPHIHKYPSCGGEDAIMNRNLQTSSLLHKCIGHDSVVTHNATLVLVSSEIIQNFRTQVCTCLNHSHLNKNVHAYFTNMMT